MLTFRPAKPSDARTIAALHVASWQWAYRNILPDAFLRGLSVDDRCRNWTRMLVSGTSHVHLACLGEELAGWASHGMSRDDDHDAGWGEIHAMYLSPAFLRQGIGSALMTQVLAQMAALGHAHASLWVLEKNIAARGFYEHAGFIVEGRTRALELGGISVTERRYARPLSPP